jgi:hypothetical protein
MQLGQIIEALRNDLVAVAAVGDEQTAGVAQRISVALEGSIGLRMVDAFAAAALELNAQLPDGHVEVRLAGRDPEFVYVEAEQTEPAIPGDIEALARISLRLPEGLKKNCEDAAAAEGVSLNTWIVRAIARVASGGGGGGATRRKGNRLTGYARS